MLEFQKQMNKVLKTFLAGAIVSVPLIITIWVVYSLGVGLGGLVFKAAATFCRPLANVPLDSWLRMPIVWVVVVCGLIFLVGLGTRFWGFARVLRLTESLLERVPLVKTVYTATRDMMKFFSGQEGSIGKVVLYKVPGQETRMLAILTNEHPIGLPAEHAANMVAIWLPMSYQLGGYMLYVPHDSVEPVDMSVEQVMKLAATAEVGAKRLLSKELLPTGQRGQPV